MSGNSVNMRWQRPANGPYAYHIQMSSELKEEISEKVSAIKNRISSLGLEIDVEATYFDKSILGTITDMPTALEGIMQRKFNIRVTGDLIDGKKMFTVDYPSMDTWRENPIFTRLGDLNNPNSAASEVVTFLKAIWLDLYEHGILRY